MKRAGAWVEVWGRGVRAGGKEEGSGGLRSSPFNYTFSQACPSSRRRPLGCGLRFAWSARGQQHWLQTEGTSDGSALLCTCSSGAGMKPSTSTPPPHTRRAYKRAHTHTATPHTDFLFSVSVYAWLLSKQSKRMSHFRDRWFKPKATCSLSLWQWQQSKLQSGLSGNAIKSSNQFLHVKTVYFHIFTHRLEKSWGGGFSERIAET